MSDSNDDKTISVTGKKTFSLKRPSVEQGMVRQEMGRGRTKAVVVEPAPAPAPVAAAPKAAPSAPAPAAAAPKAAPSAPAPVAAAKAAPKPAPKAAPSRPTPPKPAPRGAVLNQLSASEIEARRRALQDSRVRDVEERKRAAEDAVRKAEEDARRAVEEAASRYWKTPSWQNRLKLMRWLRRKQQPMHRPKPFRQPPAKLCADVVAKTKKKHHHALLERRVPVARLVLAPRSLVLKRPSRLARRPKKTVAVAS